MVFIIPIKIMKSSFKLNLKKTIDHLRTVDLFIFI